MARIDDVDCLLARWFVFLVCYLPPPYPRLIAPGVCMVALPSKQTVTESAHLNKFVYSFPAPDDVFPFIFIVAAASDCGCCFFGRFTEHHLLLRLLLLLQVCFRCKDCKRKKMDRDVIGNIQAHFYDSIKFISCSISDNQIERIRQQICKEYVKCA